MGYHIPGSMLFKEVIKRFGLVCQEHKAQNVRDAGITQHKLVPSPSIRLFVLAAITLLAFSRFLN